MITCRVLMRNYTDIINWGMLLQACACVYVRICNVSVYRSGMPRKGSFHTLLSLWLLKILEEIFPTWEIYLEGKVSNAGTISQVKPSLFVNISCSWNISLSRESHKLCNIWTSFPWLEVLQLKRHLAFALLPFWLAKACSLLVQAHLKVPFRNFSVHMSI